MNNNDFTSLALSNIGNIAKCRKSKPFSLDNKILHGYYEYRAGCSFKVVGFVCCEDEQTIILQDENGDQDCIAWREFKRYFCLLADVKIALAGHQQGRPAPISNASRTIDTFTSMRTPDIPSN